MKSESYTDFLQSFGITQSQAELFLFLVVAVIVIGYVMTKFGQVIIVGALVVFLYMVYTNHPTGTPIGDKNTQIKDSHELEFMNECMSLMGNTKEDCKNISKESGEPTPSKEDVY